MKDKTKQIRSIIQDAIEGRKCNNEATIAVLALDAQQNSVKEDEIIKYLTTQIELHNLENYFNVGMLSGAKVIKERYINRNKPQKDEKVCCVCYHKAKLNHDNLCSICSELADKPQEEEKKCHATHEEFMRCEGNPLENHIKCQTCEHYKVKPQDREKKTPIKKQFMPKTDSNPKAFK